MVTHNLSRTKTKQNKEQTNKQTNKSNTKQNKKNQTKTKNKAKQSNKKTQLYALSSFELQFSLGFVMSSYVIFLDNGSGNGIIMIT